MDISTFAELIGVLGFPIVCAGALGFFVYKLWQQSADRENRLFEELTESRTINGKFAEIIAQYEVKLDEMQGDIKDIKDTLHSNFN